MPTIPNKLYKYCTQSVYEQHLSQGEIQFGRASYYRMAYEEGRGFGDQYESSKAFSVNSLITTKDLRSNRALRENMNLTRWRGKIYINSVPGRVRFVRHWADCFLFSLTTTYDSATHARWNASDNYNSCIIIDDARSFIETICDIVVEGIERFVIPPSPPRLVSHTVRVGHVDYIDVPADITKPYNGDDFAKDSNKFGHEREYRIQLRYTPDITTPSRNFLRIKAQRLKQFIRLHKKINE